MGYVMGGLISAFLLWGLLPLLLCLALLPSFFGAFLVFLRGLFCSGAFFPVFGGGRGLVAFFQLVSLFGGGPFFVPFIIIKGGGGVGPSFRFPAEAKTKKTRPKKQGSKKGSTQKKGPRTPPLPKILGSLVPFFGGPPFLALCLGCPWPFFGLFWVFFGGIFSVPFFSLHNKN